MAISVKKFLASAFLALTCAPAFAQQTPDQFFDQLAKRFIDSAKGNCPSANGIADPKTTFRILDSYQSAERTASSNRFTTTLNAKIQKLGGGAVSVVVAKFSGVNGMYPMCDCSAYLLKRGGKPVVKFMFNGSDTMCSMDPDDLADDAPVRAQTERPTLWAQFGKDSDKWATIQGAVEGVYYEEPGDKMSGSIFFSYAYAVGGNNYSVGIYRKKSNVFEADKLEKEHPKGSSIEIKYDPSSPAKSFIPTLPSAEAYEVHRILAR